MELIQRLKKIIEYSGISVRAFGIKCGVSQATLDKQLKGLRGVSMDTILCTLNAYPEISAEWLLRDKGDMIISKSAEDDNERVFKLVDTITTLQETINAKTETIKTLNERIKQLESQLNIKTK
ncbi:MAG: XRE family transcriptional regulator [Duncaniella sp.]|nr:XRE family transcriptional regulator [Duncaniella sp.]